MNSKFYNSPENGVIEVINGSSLNISSLVELVPNTVEASGEKHKPEVSVKDGLVSVNVGSINHPMEEVHWIEWVQLNTDKGSYRKVLNPGQAPNVSFVLNDEKPLGVYAYCNLHGLWLTEL
jgi:superoxide reductase